MLRECNLDSTTKTLREFTFVTVVNAFMKFYRLELIHIKYVEREFIRSKIRQQSFLKFCHSLNVRRSKQEWVQIPSVTIYDYARQGTTYDLCLAIDEFCLVLQCWRMVWDFHKLHAFFFHKHMKSGNGTRLYLAMSKCEPRICLSVCSTKGV